MHQRHRLLRFGASALLLGTMVIAPLGASAEPAASSSQTYLVVYKQAALPADVGSAIARAGGSLVYGYDAIGVAVAASSSSTFRDSLLRDSRVENASATSGFATRLDPSTQDAVEASSTALATPAQSTGGRRQRPGRRHRQPALGHDRGDSSYQQPPTATAAGPAWAAALTTTPVLR